MKLNNKGFAISTIMYMILIMAIVLIALTLSILSSRKLILDKIKKETNNNIYNMHSLSYRQALEVLKDEAIDYLSARGSNSGEVSVEDLNSSIDEEVLKEYKLDTKIIMVTYENLEYKFSFE